MVVSKEGPVAFLLRYHRRLHLVPERPFLPVETALWIPCTPLAIVRLVNPTAVRAATARLDPVAWSRSDRPPWRRPTEGDPGPDSQEDV